MLDNIPLTWLQKYLSDSSVAQVIMGQSPDSSTYNEGREGLPFYQGKTDFGKISPTPRIWCSKPVKIAEANDVLLSVRAPVGAVNMCTEKSCIGRGLCAIRAKEIVLPKFLYYFFVFYEPILKTQGSGAVFDAITKAYVDKIKVPIPPTLAEQQEIVHVLDTMSDIIRLREECISHAQDLIPALFREMFGKIERNTRLNSIISLEYGKALKAENRNSEGEYPVYGSNGIVGYHDSYIVEGQTIIIGRKGSCGKLNLTQKSCFPIDTCFYIKQKTPVNWYYLFYALQELNVENMLKDAVIPGINRNDYLRNSIRLAPTSEQEQFAQKAIEIESYIKEQEEERDNAKQMFQSLLHHAFTGELTRHKFGGDANG